MLAGLQGFGSSVPRVTNMLPVPWAIVAVAIPVNKEVRCSVTNRHSILLSVLRERGNVKSSWSVLHYAVWLWDVDLIRTDNPDHGVAANDRCQREPCNNHSVLGASELPFVQSFPPANPDETLQWN